MALFVPISLVTLQQYCARFIKPSSRLNDDRNSIHKFISFHLSIKLLTSIDVGFSTSAVIRVGQPVPIRGAPDKAQRGSTGAPMTKQRTPKGPSKKNGLSFVDIIEDGVSLVQIGISEPLFSYIILFHVLFSSDIDI